MENPRPDKAYLGDKAQWGGDAALAHRHADLFDGHRRAPAVWMKPGDVLEVEISGIGTLRNPVVDE